MLSVVSGLFGLLAVVNCNVIVYTQITPHVIEDQFLDVPAGFGPELPVEGLRGLLVVGEPADGCGNLTAPPAVDNFTKNWIVLVARYNCSFEVKVRNAMAAGYGCAIVHNVNSSELETMFAKNPEGIDIPSVFVGDIAGLLLAEKYTYDKGFYIMVNDDVPFNINTQLLLPFGMVVVVCLVIILIFAIVKCIKDRRRARRNRLPNRSLKKIPTCKFSKGDPYETCAICLDDYQEGERLRVLPCAHAYHAKCVDPWLTQNRRVCPVCKRTVLMAGEREARPRDSDSDDTEPLLAAAPPRTQGGTFDPPRVNPLARPSFLERLRRARPRPLQETSPTEESEQAGDGNEQGRSEDTSPLLAPAAASAAAVSERRPRRARRARRTRSAPRHAAPAPAPAQPSINHTERGEIGVAALPAPAVQAPAAPHHVEL